MNARTHRTLTPLPVAETTDGQPRRNGVEIELSGLAETEVVQIVETCLGGRAEQREQHRWSVEDTRIGTVVVELDTRFAKGDPSQIAELALDAAKSVVPVEIITEPLGPEAFEQVPKLMDALNEAGAKGTSDGVLLGFGIHFNPEIAGFDHPHTARTIVAYGLLESWMRDAQPVDPSRRLLPFIQPWPENLADALARAPDASLSTLRDHYARHVSDRNFGLDLLPLFRAFDPDAFDRAFGDVDSASRPAFHFRLPDCRVGEGDWSIADEWDRWVLVERLAANGELLHRLAEARRTSADNWIAATQALIGKDGTALW
ncbi:amidoligase family protein [Thalassococcus sp. CAU 1522]|uniref:Amidoligase family protein n=1 Tax=Thalassococcus arenae TaxID=2851652 RepID=A0ABS6N2Y9_9RHOB|nr:amidoligase family protein [Thalassococcus arenae]MBV2358381.1 amidoligase family protein [Thalassococcus arenae]